MKNKKGISLITIIITVIVIIILATAIILMFREGGILDNARKAKFMNNFRSVEDGVNLFSMSSLKTNETVSYELPVLEKLTLDEKREIESKVPTLNTKILELNQGKTLDNTELYWIDLEKAGTKSLPKDRKYIIDISTRQIYDYLGEKFEGKRWHTLDGGVAEGSISNQPVVDEIWDGWIKLTLYYPAGATEKEWRLGTEGEIRTDNMLVWQDYTGPITIPIDRTKDVWIRYNLNGEEVIIPPVGTLLVDIAVDNTGDELVEKVKAKITYDKDAKTKLYKVGNSDWMEYTGEFEVTENCLIQAKATKTEEIYNQDGTLLTTRNLAGKDSYYVDNIGAKEIDGSLPAPTITRLDASNETEKARVQVTYPAEAVKKIYKINYGIEEEYTSEISIQKYGTNVIAYYYDAAGKRSNAVEITINDTTGGESPKPPIPHYPPPPKDPNGPSGPNPNDVKYNLPAPTITRLEAQNVGEKARIQITYPANAVRKIFTKNSFEEQIYSDIISIPEWGTHIIAYYYDEKGDLSQASWIVVNEIPTPAEPYPPLTKDPKDIIPAPEIVCAPTTIGESTTVSVNSPATADKVYIKLGRYGIYQEYTDKIVVRENMEVYAYYKTYDGEKSEVARNVIKNIRKVSGGDSSKIKPYVYIDANPYPWTGSYGTSKVLVTLIYSDADTIEYSEDGIIYKAYTDPFEVTKNKRIYARGKNINGITDTYLDITNIKSDNGKVEPPEILSKLGININVEPEPILTETRLAKVKVKIEYDEKATEKYYTIGIGGELKTYTEPFEVSTNCTIYAYAKGEKAQGTASKKIDNVLDGISEPEIIAIPNNNVTASKVDIKIEYDRYAKIKRYSVNGGSIRDYIEDITVTENGSTIYAYSENEKGQKSEATYTINNIVPEPPVLLLDKGDYYILKLSYPERSSGREYKWKENGEWKAYQEAGIMLIKPQAKDRVIKDGTLVKIEDENGKLITFTGDYYLIDVPINELMENISMRWDRVTPTSPQILLNTSEPAKEVSATIVYGNTLIKKQYRILEPGQEIGEWQDYTGPISIKKNNTTIYAKGMDDAEVWSQEGIKKVTNIDEVPPVIKLTADLETATQSLSVRVGVTDDVEIGEIKWASGVLGESYFENNGTQTINNSVVKITNNGYYTFYAEDKVGNKQTYTLNVTNIDLTAPKINIQIDPETALGLTTNVTIDYGDANTKQYKIGTSNAVWTNYTTTFAVSSYTILANNWQNTDGTVTVYAKGKDSVGNETVVQKKIVSLDLDKPNTPVITSSAGYATLTEYGTVLDAKTTITYDTRNDIDNLYSIDNGATWKAYTGAFQLSSGNIIAKSVKKSTGLEVSVTKTIAMPSNALGLAAYDKNTSTSVIANGYINVDSNLSKRKIRLLMRINKISQNAKITVNYLDINKNIISSAEYQSTEYYAATVRDVTVTIPENTSYILFGSSGGSGYISEIIEIELLNEATFSATNGYMLLHSNPEKSIRQPYQMVTINYFPTSVQKLYRIGTESDWQNYLDQPIKVEQGKTIYAKGIDKYGIETRSTTNYTANVTDALKKEAFDNDDSTYITNITNQYMEIDNSMQGNTVRIKTYSGASSSYTLYIRFLNENKDIISSISRYNGTFDEVYTIPENTKWIRYDGYTANSYSRLYEIQTSNEPKFNAVNGYMLLHIDPTKTIKKPYQMVTINYFPTSVQKLYRVGATGDWLNYTGQLIRCDEGQTIYAKGIDKFGNETRITSSYTINVSGALKQEAFDGNTSTSIIANGYVAVDKSMSNKQARFIMRINKISQNAKITVNYLDSNKNIISSGSYQSTEYYAATVRDITVTIPENTSYILFSSSGSSGYTSEVMEIII